MLKLALNVLRGDKLFTEQELQLARDPDLPPILSLDWPDPWGRGVGRVGVPSSQSHCDWIKKLKNDHLAIHHLDERREQEQARREQRREERRMRRSRGAYRSP